MNQKILLVEPGYESTYPPLGLMKISTWHNRKNDHVGFLKLDKKGNPLTTRGIISDNYDLIYITSLFTYHTDEVIKAIRYCQAVYPQAVIKVGGIMATLLPEEIIRNTGVFPHQGLLPEVEDCPPDYSLFPDLKCSITFTTRGCPRTTCSFCAVKLHEPDFFVKENWENDIDKAKSRIIFWDNNWLCSPNFFKDVEKLKKINKSFDFNQALDCRLFDNEKAKALSQLRIHPLRFAFDNHTEDGKIQKAIELAKKYDFKDIRVYVLYNSTDEEDTPEYFYYRINEINQLGALSYPMRFRPINSAEARYVSTRWDTHLLRGLKLSLMFYYTKGMINKKREPFTGMYCDNAQQFVNKLYKIYQDDRERNKAKSKTNMTKEEIPILF